MKFMSNALQFAIDRLKGTTGLRLIWPASLLIGLIAAPLAFVFKTHSTWIVGASILLGTALVLLAEIFGKGTDDSEEAFASLPAEHRGIASYRNKLSFVIGQSEKEPGQLELSEIAKNFPSVAKLRKTARILKDEQGRDILVIECDRFIAVLIDRMIADADKAAEHALRVGLKRFGQLHHVSEDLDRFLNDRAIIEIIKSDFRGNILTIVNRSGEKVIKDFIRYKEQQEEKERAR